MEKKIEQVLQELREWLETKGWEFESLTVRKPGEKVDLVIAGQLLQAPEGTIENFVDKVSAHWNETKNLTPDQLKRWTPGNPNLN